MTTNRQWSMQSVNIKQKGNIQWDEDNLSQIEAEKPVRKRICEPKTPFYPDTEEDGSISPADDCSGGISYAAHAEAVTNALNEMVLQQQSLNEDTESSDDGADAITPDEDAMKDRTGFSFQQQRKAHYNEFQKVREHPREEFLLDEAMEKRDSGSSGLKAIQIEGTGDSIQVVDTRAHNHQT